MSLRRRSRLEALGIDVDTRLLDLWAEASLVEEWTLDLVGPFLRAAYAKGYGDALAEPERGKLARDHGYRVPRRGA